MIAPPFEVYSRRVLLCLTAPARFRLTDDEKQFVRMSLLQTLKAEALPCSPADLDSAYAYMLDRLTVAGYRALREAKAAWEADTITRLRAHLAEEWRTTHAL